MLLQDKGNNINSEEFMWLQSGQQISYTIVVNK